MSEEENKKSNKMPRYSISFTKKNIEQIKEIQNQLGLASMSETIRSCIHSTYSKTFPNYTRTGATSQNNSVSEEKPKVSKEEEKKRKAEQEQANKIATAIQVCENDLGGVVATDENDNPIMCAYFQYDGRRRFKQEIDIASVTPDLLNSQYLPTKERVMQLQDGGNVDYDVKESIEQIVGAE